jgi:hypothetical protein
MRFTDIRHDALPTGRLTIWVPTEATLARADLAPRDTRRTSHNQEGHITRALARRVDPDLVGTVPDVTGAAGKSAPTGWLAVRFDVAPCSQHTLRRAFEQWIERHETLRSGFRAEGAAAEGVTIERFTLPSGSVALEAVDLGEHADSDALGERLEDLFNSMTDPVSWPAYAFSAISTPKSTSVILAFNHLNVDGYSILLMAQEVRELVDADREHRPHDLPAVPSYIDFVEAERDRAGQAMASHDAVNQWREFLGADRDVPTFPLPDGLAPGSQIPQGSGCLPILAEDEAAAYGRWCRARGVSAGAGFLGAYTLACVRRAAVAAGEDGGAGPSEQDRLRVLVSTHTRNEPHWALALGWFTAVAPFDVTLPPGADLESALPSVDEAWTRAKRGAALPLDRISELIGHPVAPRFVVSYLDARHTPGGRSWKGWRAQAYFGDVGPTDEVYAWINRMPTETYLTWRYPDNDTCRGEVEAVTALMQQIIRDAIASDPSLTQPAQEATAQW